VKRESVGEETVLFGKGWGREKAWYVRRLPSFALPYFSSGQQHSPNVTNNPLEFETAVFCFQCWWFNLERCWARAANGTHCCDITEERERAGGSIWKDVGSVQQMERTAVTLWWRERESWWFNLERCWARTANGTHCCDITEERESWWFNLEICWVRTANGTHCCDITEERERGCHER
jgi:hypothetical protein